MKKPTHRYLPQNAIWYWTTATTKAAVTLVNNKYRYQIFNINTGNEVESGETSTLPQAKSQVFSYENRMREGYIHPYDRQGKEKKAFYIERKVLEYFKDRMKDKGGQNG